MNIKHTIVEFDGVTEFAIGDVLFIPEEHLEVVKEIAGVDADDPDDSELIYCYDLTESQVLQIADLVGKSVTYKANSSFSLLSYRDDKE